MKYQDMGGGYIAQILEHRDGSVISCEVNTTDFGWVGTFTIERNGKNQLSSTIKTDDINSFVSHRGLARKIQDLQKLEQMYIKLLGKFGGEAKDGS